MTDTRADGNLEQPWIRQYPNDLRRIFAEVFADAEDRGLIRRWTIDVTPTPGKDEDLEKFVAERVSYLAETRLKQHLRIRTFHADDCSCSDCCSGKG